MIDPLRLRLTWVAASLLVACTPDPAEVLGVDWTVDRVDFDTLPYTRGAASRTFTVANRGERSVYLTTEGFGEALEPVLHASLGAQAVLLPGEVREFDVLLDPIRDAKWPSGVQSATLPITAARPVDGHAFSGDASRNRAEFPEKWLSDTHDIEIVFTILCDLDADGEDARTCGGGDCDDRDKAVNSAQVETCDGVDQDCDGVVDDDASDQRAYYVDADLDGYGDRTRPAQQRCTGGQGWAQNADDCDDTTSLYSPARTEVCGNDLDDDCDDDVDETCIVDTDVDPVDTDAPPDPLTLDLDGDGLLGATELTLGTDPDDSDSDDDGLFDGEEINTYGTNPKLADTDGDTLSDHEELRTRFTNPKLADTDGDTLRDDDELRVHLTNPRLEDTDDDGLDDGMELSLATDPNEEDTDGDGLEDGDEVDLFTDPLEVDTDGDDLDDHLEVRVLGTNPRAPDSDDDGLDDGVEYATTQTDPTLADTDGDGLDDKVELDDTDTRPRDPDSDDDGLDDGDEVLVWDTDPNHADSDRDELSDGLEVDVYDTDPLLADTDGDTLTDADEVLDTLTNPLDADPDDDDLDDAEEVAAGTDPFDEDTDDDTLLDGDEVKVVRTSPFQWDTDRDRLSDADEVDSPTSPLDADSDRDGLNDGDELFAGLNPEAPDSVIPDEAATLPTGTLRVTELHFGRAGCLDGMPTWIEIANPTADWVDITGVRLNSQTVTLKALSRPNDADFLLAPGEHAVVAQADTDCPPTWRPNYTWSGAVLSTSDQLVVTFSSTTILTLDYRGWQLPIGATLSLDPAGAPDQVDDWCAGFEVIPGTDILGSPGLSNPDCL